MTTLKTFCEICNNISWRLINNRLIKCQSCGLVRAQNKYFTKKFDDLYVHDYFFGTEYYDYIKEKPSLEKNFNQRIKNLEMINILKKSINVIEIGSAYGFFMNLIKNKVKSIIGFEISKEAVAYANKNYHVDSRNQDFLNYNGKKVDLICMWDVIEHLPKPQNLIKKTYCTLNHGGHLVLTTGDIGSFLAKIQGNLWRLIHPPTHLFYFNKKTITLLLEQNGFTIVSINYIPIYRNISSIFYKFGLNKLSTFLEHLELGNICIGINTFDIMEIISVKK